MNYIILKRRGFMFNKKHLAIILVSLMIVSAFSSCKTDSKEVSSDSIVKKTNKVNDISVVESYTDYMQEMAEIAAEPKVVVLTVNGLEITDFNIKGELLAKNEAVKNELDSIDAEEISDEEKASKKEQYHYITREDAIKNCIDFWAQVSEADKRGIVKSLDDSKQFAKDNLDMIKEGAQNGDSNCIEELSKIEEYNKTIGQTEEDYINNGAEMLVNVAKITQLRNQVIESFSDEQKQNEEEEYQKFVDELVKKAKIEWK